MMMIVLEFRGLLAGRAGVGSGLGLLLGRSCLC